MRPTPALLDIAKRALGVDERTSGIRPMAILAVAFSVGLGTAAISGGL